MRNTIKATMLGLVLATSGTLAVSASVQAQEVRPAAVAVAQTKVNINLADAQTLSSQLNGIGPAKAQAIIDYRTAHGAFQSIDELIEVKGIGPATLERLRPQLSLD